MSLKRARFFWTLAAFESGDPTPPLARLGAMDQNKTTLERAFDLAGSGISLSDIRARLKAEGYDERQLHGCALNSQLNQLSKKARADGQAVANATRSESKAEAG